MWIDRIGPYRVEKRPIPRPSGAYIPMSQRPRVVLHTTEGSSVEGAWGYNYSQRFGAHFYVGNNRIIQARPLDAQASTLPAHNDIGYQIEAVGFSKQNVWLPDKSTLEPLVELGRFFSTGRWDIPLKRPEGWHDDLRDIKTILASDNTRRKQRVALEFRGWVGHLEIPDCAPTWHWDPGAFNYEKFFGMVGGEDGMLNYRDFKRGVLRRMAGDPAPSDEGDERFGWRFADWAGTRPKVEAHQHSKYAVVEHEHDYAGADHKHAHTHDVVGKAE